MLMYSLFLVKITINKKCQITWIGNYVAHSAHLTLKVTSKSIYIANRCVKVLCNKCSNLIQNLRKTEENGHFHHSFMYRAKIRILLKNRL